MHLLWLLFAALVAAATSPILVKTANGTIQGGSCPHSESNFFLSIPYADPPTGTLRYKAPQYFSGSYNGTLNGTRRAPACSQFGTNNIAPGPQSEDCLYLDIYAPRNATSTSRLPVKVWLHGGTFEIGSISDPLYDGCLSSGNAIVVAVNYRLGPLGYLALKNTSLTGNYGIFDQLQALRWIHDNIAAFGGGSDKILLFGQSAGATASFALATLPEAKSLINAVIMESGGGVDLPTVSTAQEFHAEFVNALGCSVTDVDCIYSKNPAQLNDTFNGMPTNHTVFVFSLVDYHGATFPWSPLAESSLFPIQPSRIGVQVPAVFGSNGAEGSIFALATFGVNGVQNLTAKDYNDFLTVNFGALASQISQEYPLSSFNDSVFDAITIIMRDYAFRCSAYRGASLAAMHGQPVWTYSFNQTPSCPWEDNLTSDVALMLGATHTAEIPFVFGEVSNLPLPRGNCSFNTGEIAISAFMESSWTNMAANAMPESGWPRFFPNTTLGINFQGGIVAPGTMDYSMCDFWDKINSAILSATTASGTPSQSNNTAPGSASSTSASPLPYQGGACSFNARFSSLLITAATSLVVAL